MELRFSIDDLTLGDLEAFEEASGGDDLIAELKAGRNEDGTVKLRVKHLTALVYVIARRDDPDFTLDDARKVKVNELVIDAGGDARPTDAAG